MEVRVVRLVVRSLLYCLILALLQDRAAHQLQRYLGVNISSVETLLAEDERSAGDGVPLVQSCRMVNLLDENPELGAEQSDLVIVAGQGQDLPVRRPADSLDAELVLVGGVVPDNPPVQTDHLEIFQIVIK